MATISNEAIGALQSSSKFIDPIMVISQLDLRSGITVADFGCGTGYFSIPIAKKIGKEGVVYSLDIVPQKLEAVASQAKTQGITNIITKRANLENEEGSKLGAESIDWVIMKDVLFQNKKKSNMFKEAKRVLKPGGKILIVEWRSGNSSIGPDSNLRISRDEINSLINDNQLLIVKDIEAGDFHYGLILSK